MGQILLTPAGIPAYVDSLAVPGSWTALEYASVQKGALYDAAALAAAARGWAPDDGLRKVVQGLIDAARIAWEAGANPSPIPSTSIVFAEAVSTFTPAVPTDPTRLRVQFDTILTDPLASITTGAAWKFTVPAGYGGVYFINVNAQINITAVATLFQAAVNIVRTPAIQSPTILFFNEEVDAAALVLEGGRILPLNAGDSIYIDIGQGGGGTAAMLAGWRFAAARLGGIAG